MTKNFMKLISTAFFFVLFGLSIYAQNVVEGTVVEASKNESLPGASVVIKGTTVGTITDINGKFSLKTNLSGKKTLVVSYVGYLTQEIEVEISGTKDMGTIKMELDAIGIEEVSVIASVAIDRKTPVAVSNITPMVINEKLGRQEFPEMLKSTPSVYATKQGGGFGDSRVNIRGFDQRNTATMINGVPVNDMENGWVYWSNWAGLSDVTRTMQIQRGLGASKVAVPSLGGTINILTKTTDMEKGGNVYTTVGNYGYTKMGFTVSTGLTENNWAATISLAKAEGDGFVDATQFESYSYYANISKRISDKHTLSLSVFGAPQWHGQRTSDLTIEEFKNSRRGIQYNQDWGYRNGEVYHVRRNFYHKPQAIFNHFWNINSETNVMTAIYASIGTGGGTGSYGNTSKFYGEYLYDGQVDFDRIVAENIALGNQGADAIMRSSNNNHAWYGILSSFNKTMGNLDMMIGIDGRYYRGEHYREVTDLLGGQFYIDGSDLNVPDKVVHEGDKIAYHNDGLVTWGGLFSQFEYNLDDLSAFVSASVSYKSYMRIDYFNYFNDNLISKIKSDSELEAHYRSMIGDAKFSQAMEGITSDWVKFLGYMFKGGANYNLNDNHNIFFNTGYFERQPDFDAVFLNYINLINDQAVNEKVFSAELGYGYRSKNLTMNLNGYYTTWKDKTFTKSFREVDQETGAYTYLIANILGVDAAHMGVEFDFKARPINNVEIRGFVSVGDWKWMNDIRNVSVNDENQNEVAVIDLFIKDVHIGDAAQTTAGLGIDFELIEGLKIGADVNYYDNVFADFDVLDRGTESADGVNLDSWKLPNYTLMDMNLRYNFDIANLSSTVYCNVNNLFNTEYISDASDGADHTWHSARVYYGWGRSWSVGLKVRF